MKEKWCLLLNIFILVTIYFLLYYIMKNKRTKRKKQTKKKKYTKKNKALLNDNIIYIKNFLNKNDYNLIQTLNKDMNNFKKENFRYIRPLNKENNKDKTVYDIFYDDKYIRKIQRKVNPKIYPSDFPIEHRFYHKESEGMRWHKDTLLYEKPQYEAIYTIDNLSESETQWYDDKGKLNSLWTDPNSLLIVKAQGYMHGVTPPKSGIREILKLIYTQTDKVNENYHKEIVRFNNFQV